MMALKTERVCDFGCRLLADVVCMLCGRDACKRHSPYTFYTEVGISRPATSEEINQNRGTGSSLFVVDAQGDCCVRAHGTVFPAGHLCHECSVSLLRSSFKLDPVDALTKAANDIADNLKAAYAAAALSR